MNESATMKVLYQERTANGEVLTMKAPAANAACEIHDWPTPGLGRRFFEAMRERHPRGINACRECITRARDELKGALND